MHKYSKHKIRDGSSNPPWKLVSRFSGRGMGDGEVELAKRSGLQNIGFCMRDGEFSCFSMEGFLLCF